MKIFREELQGGVLFDSETMSFRIEQSKPEDFTGMVLPLTDHGDHHGLLSSPISVYYELTARCNLSCHHCFASASAEEHGRLSTEQSLQLVDELARLRVLNLRLTGGEPTCHPAWASIIGHAKERGLIVSLQTNGMYDDIEQTVATLASLALDQLSVSLDGTGPTHDALRGDGSFARLVRALDAMKQAGLVVRFNTILHRGNMHDLEPVFERAARYGRSLNLFFLRPIGRALQTSDLWLSREEHLACGQQIEHLAQTYPELKVFHSAVRPRKRGQSELLPYGSHVLCIGHDGRLWPLQYLRYQDERFSVGRWPADDLRVAWQQSTKLQGFRRWMAALRQRCLDCEQFGAPCPGMDVEVEIARLVGAIEGNPYCCRADEPPSPWDYID